jgi:quinol monooxygenase YgiN
MPLPTPPPAVALASVAVYAQEAFSDMVAIESALSTPGVKEYLKELDDLGLLPVRR